MLDTLRQPLERGPGDHPPGRRVGDLPLPGPAGARGQPVPVRHRGRRHRLHVQPAGAAALPVPAVRPAAGPDRPAGRPARRSPARRWLDGLEPPEATAVVAARVRGGPGRRGRAAGRHRAVGERQVPGRLLRERWAVPRAVAAAGRAGPGARRAVGPRLRPGAPGRLDARRPGRPVRARTPTTSPRRWACGCSGSRHDASTRTLDEDLGRRPRPARCIRGAPGAGLAEPRRRARDRRLLALRRATSDRSRPSGASAPGAAPERIRATRRRARPSRTRAWPTCAGPSGAVPGWSSPRTTSGRRCRCTPSRVATGREPDDHRPQSDRTHGAGPPRWRSGCAGAARLDELVDRSVAVVGSRASTAYGEHVAGELGYQLAERGWTVVSGGAFGIDAAAHRGALAAEAPTLAVLACGVDRPYPAGTRRPVRPDRRDRAAGQRVAARMRAARHRFLVRNRLIAALTRGTVVVEAAARSGAQATAKRAQPARPAGHGRARAGDLGDVGRLPRAAARARRPGARWSPRRRTSSRRSAARRRPGRAAERPTEPARRALRRRRAGCSTPARCAPGSAPSGWPPSPAATCSTCCGCCRRSSWPSS